MHDFAPVPALLGGALIGLAVSLFLAAHGRIAGISGIYAGVVRRDLGGRRVSIMFLVGLVLAAIAIRFVRPEAFETRWSASLPMALVAGLLVGVGTQLAAGCTSGHGVCGLSRLSLRSLVATLTFMLVAGVTVFVARHVLGGAS